LGELQRRPKDELSVVTAVIKTHMTHTNVIVNGIYALLALLDEDAYTVAPDEFRDSVWRQRGTPLPYALWVLLTETNGDKSIRGVANMVSARAGKGNRGTPDESHGGKCRRAILARIEISSADVGAEKKGG
jgi:hypothetical protein